jgi:hypothetical protein
VPAEEVVSVRAYTPALRAALAALEIAALLNLVELAARMGLDALAPGASERAPLALVVRRTFFLSALPWLLFLIGRAFARATVAAQGSSVTVRALWGTVEIPKAAIERVHRWRLPSPEQGFTLVLRSGAVGLSWTAASVVGEPDFPDARARHRARALHAPWMKLGLVPAALTFILFRLHQRIAYGDLFGEATMFGWRRWLRTLSGVAVASFCVLLIAAATLRVSVELIALITARWRPRAAARARVVLEIAAALIYYGGLIATLALRLGL